MQLALEEGATHRTSLFTVFTHSRAAHEKTGTLAIAKAIGTSCPASIVPTPSVPSPILTQQTREVLVNFHEQHRWNNGERLITQAKSQARTGRPFERLYSSRSFSLLGRLCTHTIRARIATTCCNGENVGRISRGRLALLAQKS